MCPASFPQTGAKDPRVPSILASDRGQGPPMCPASFPQTGAKDPRVPSILASDGAQDPPCAQHPRLRPGLRTPHVPSILASDRGSGPPSAQHPRLRQGLGTTRVPSIVCPRQTSLKRSQRNSVLTREKESVFKFPHKSQRPRGQRPTICSLQSLRGVGAAGWRQPGVGEGILITAGRMGDWKSRKSQDVVRVRPYGLVLWVSWS